MPRQQAKIPFELLLCGGKELSNEKFIFFIKPRKAPLMIWFLEGQVRVNQMNRSQRQGAQ